MELGPKEVGIIVSILVAALALGARGIWVYGSQVAELKTSHERERATWNQQMEELRDSCRKAEAREKVLFDLAFGKREILAKAVDVAVATKG